MIVRCPDCRSQYEITTQPKLGTSVKVRCPRCKAVFPVRAVRKKTPVERGTSVAQKDPPLVTDPKVARRMARVMISEIVLNRQTDRNQALRTRTVLSRFGPAIVSAYSVYTKKVSPDLKSSRSIFREAINEILGDGSPLI